MDWSDEEDRILLTYARKFDLNWPGWPEVLPGKSKNKLRRRLHGLLYGQCSEVTSIGFDDKILTLSNTGMSPSEIDRRLSLTAGTAKRRLVALWARDKEE